MKIRNILRLVFGGTAALVGLIIFFSLWFTVEEGQMVVYQNPMFATVEGFTEPGFHVAMPFFSRTTEYNKVATITYDKVKTNSSFSAPPIQVRFPDNYTGTIEATFRFALPSDSVSLIKLQKDFRSYRAVVTKLLARTAKDVVMLAATQYTSEDFFQGGLPLYKANLIDYLNNGTPILEKRQVERVVAGVSQQGKSADKKTQKEKQFVEVFVAKTDANGQIMRSDAPLREYGISVTQVTLGETVPAEDLQKLLVRTKEIFAERRAIRAAQENARQSRITARLEGETARETAVQKAVMAKEIAVVEAEKRVDLATQEKAMQLVVKDRELEKALKDKEIQLAKAESALAEAKAIKAVGLAHAAVEAAMLKARNNPVYRAQLQKEMAIQVSENMKSIKVEMPQIVFGGGYSGGGGNTSIDTVMKLLGANLAIKMAEDNAVRPVVARRK